MLLHLFFPECGEKHFQGNTVIKCDMYVFCSNNVIVTITKYPKYIGLIVADILMCNILTKNKLKKLHVTSYIAMNPVLSWIFGQFFLI